MHSPRHRLVVEHPLRRRAVQVGVPASVLAAVAVTGVVSSALTDRATSVDGQAASRTASLTVPRAVQVPADANAPDGGSGSPYQIDRLRSISRSTERVTLRHKPDVTDHVWSTERLNLWPSAAEHGEPITVLKQGEELALTGVRRDGFAQVLRAGQVRWVTQEFLSEKKPAAPTAARAGGGGVTSAPCPDGSGTEAGLTPAAVRLFRSVCHAFPALRTYGGYDGHGEHSSGKAIDFMIDGSSSLGQAVADWARAHAGELDLYDVIWAQHIWTPERAGEGWRSMPDRGSPTANHFDHVHISVN